MLSFYELSYDDLLEYCQQQELPVASARLLFNWHYKKNQRDVFSHQHLSQAARRFFYSHFDFTLPQVYKLQMSEDKTVKFLFRLADERFIESVLIPFQGKYTLCVSSQVGCAMNCSFCYTGQQGFGRHLSAAEIIGQYLQAKTWLTANRPHEDRILNVVFMGQGEPLHNFDSVKKACHIFLSQYGLSLAAHKITISTSGYLPGLKRWPGEMPNVNIALSLHSVFNEKRDVLIPINRKYPLIEILPLVDAIPQGEKRFVTYEYLLIDQLNDTESDAHATGQTLSGRKAYVNLIPFNSVPGTYYRRPNIERVERFKDILESYGIPVTIRTTKGDAILAACGQLNTQAGSAQTVSTVSTTME